MDSGIKPLCGALTRHKIKDSYLQGFICSSDTQVWQVIVFLSTEARVSDVTFSTNSHEDLEEHSWGWVTLLATGLASASTPQQSGCGHRPIPEPRQEAPWLLLPRMRVLSPRGSLPLSLLSPRPTCLHRNLRIWGQKNLVT